MSYPRSVFHPREDVTRAAMKEHDIKKKLFNEKCEELAPNYYKLPLRERMKIRAEVEEILGFGLN